MSGHHSLFSMTSIWQKKSEKQKVPLTPTELAISKHLPPVQGFLMQIRKHSRSGSLRCGCFLSYVRIRP